MINLTSLIKRIVIITFENVNFNDIVAKMVTQVVLDCTHPHKKNN